MLPCMDQGIAHVDSGKKSRMMDPNGLHCPCQKLGNKRHESRSQDCSVNLSLHLDSCQGCSS